MFSAEVESEQGTVFSGQDPSLIGLITSVKGLPPRLPQILTPPRSDITIGATFSTFELHLLFFPTYLEFKHFSSMPPHFLIKTGSHSSSHSLLVTTFISMNGYSSQS